MNHDRVVRAAVVMVEPGGRRKAFSTALAGPARQWRTTPSMSRITAPRASGDAIDSGLVPMAVDTTVLTRAPAGAANLVRTMVRKKPSIAAGYGIASIVPRDAD